MYQACEKRVEEEEGGDQKHCTGQYFDYWGCVDKCVSSFFLSNIFYSLCVGLEEGSKRKLLQYLLTGCPKISSPSRLLPPF